MMSARKPPLDRGRQRRLDRLTHPAIGYGAALTELDDPGECCAKAHHAFQTLVDVEQMSRRQSAKLAAVLLGSCREGSQCTNDVDRQSQPPRTTYKPPAPAILGTIAT